MNHECLVYLMAGFIVGFFIPTIFVLSLILFIDKKEKNESI